jgi:hypothetical protein
MLAMIEEQLEIKRIKYSSYLTEEDSALLALLCEEKKCSKAKALSFLLSFWDTHTHTNNEKLAIVSNEEKTNEDIDIVVSQVKEAVLLDEDFKRQIENLAFEMFNTVEALHKDVEEISYELLNGKINEISLQLENLDAKVEHIEDNRIDKIQEKLNRVYTDFYGVLEYAKRQGYDGPPTTKRIKPKGFKTI